MEYLFLSFPLQPVCIFKRSLLQTAYRWAVRFYSFCQPRCLSTFLLTIKRGGEGLVNSTRPAAVLSNVAISCSIRCLCLCCGPAAPPPLAWTERQSAWLSELLPPLGGRVLPRSRRGRRALCTRVSCLGMLGESRGYGVMLDPVAGQDATGESFFPSFSLVKCLLFLLLSVCLLGSTSLRRLIL